MEDNQPQLHTDEYGIIWISNTRITLESIITPYIKGLSAEELNKEFPTLSLQDVSDIIEYYLNNQEELHEYLVQRDAERKHQQLPRQSDKQKKVFIIIAILALVVTAVFAFIQIKPNQDDFSTNIEQLEYYFDLSQLPEPTSVQWVKRTLQTPNRLAVGPTGYIIIAVLEYETTTGLFSEQLQLELHNNDLWREVVLLERWVPEIITARTRIPYNANTLLKNSILSYGYVAFVENYVLIVGVTM